jgi:DNA mismatch endonuclease, patch repair protein
MPDQLSSAARSLNMARIRQKDTQPELIVRRAVRRLGYGYRLHSKDLPGRPDLVFRSRRKVIFVHGCFWHVHQGCRRATTPRSNEEFWKAKLKRNVERDIANLAALRKEGWGVLTIWQCELKDREALDRRLVEFMKN